MHARLHELLRNRRANLITYSAPAERIYLLRNRRANQPLLESLINYLINSATQSISRDIQGATGRTLYIIFHALV